jgi:hypothetical protein
MSLEATRPVPEGDRPTSNARQVAAKPLNGSILTEAATERTIEEILLRIADRPSDGELPQFAVLLYRSDGRSRLYLSLRPITKAFRWAEVHGLQATPVVVRLVPITLPPSVGDQR